MVAGFPVCARVAQTMTPTRPYLFYGATQALCATCLRTVQAKEVIEDGRVYLLKRCPAHGPERVLISEDAAYWRLGRERFLKAPEQPLQYNSPHRWGCPYDCGICPEHEQHGCVSLLEITDSCNLRCPTCYAGSGPERLTHRPLPVIQRMLDRICANEGEPDIVQISGGEPTLHPDFWTVMDLCRTRPIRHRMLNTNGVRIATEDGFAERLAGYGPGFEVYLQFDSLEREPLLALRGADLRDIRRRALDRLNALNLSTTLVVTVRAGLNDGELGRIIDFALTQPCVRGVTIQPVQDAGRVEGFDPARHRLTVAGVRRRILEQTSLFRPEDIIPVPCHPDCLAMAYALKRDGGAIPLTGLVPPEVLIAGGRNTIVYESGLRPAGGAAGGPGCMPQPATPDLAAALIGAFSTAHGAGTAADAVQKLLCCLPGIAGTEPLRYDQVFRVIVMQFLDRHSLDLRSVRKTCVHIAHPDGKRVIPFDTYNLFYRDGLESSVLAPLRAATGL